MSQTAVSPTAAPPADPRVAWLRPLLPGLVLSVMLAGAGVALAELEQSLFGHAWVEALVLALLLGAIVRNILPATQRFQAGTGFASKQILEVGVAMLGLGVDARALFAAGPLLVGLVVAGVAASMFVSFGIGRAIGLSSRLAVLVAAGNSICGNSAIVAIAPTIKADKKDVASAISLTAVLGLLVVLTLPATIPLLGLSHYQYGVLAGMSVYAVPQVLAATLPVSRLAGEVGTLVKLTRVVMLGPIIIVLGLLFNRGQSGAGRANWRTYLPWFVVVFLLFIAVRGLGLVGNEVATPAREVSRWLTILAMAGLGFGVELAAVRRVGPRVGLVVILSLLFLIGSVLTAIRLLGIGV